MFAWFSDRLRARLTRRMWKARGEWLSPLSKADADTLVRYTVEVEIDAFRRCTRVLLAVAALVIMTLSLTACEPGPECIRSHSEMTWVPVWTGKTSTLHPVWTSVCDSYAKETAKP